MGTGGNIHKDWAQDLQDIHERLLHLMGEIPKAQQIALETVQRDLARVIMDMKGFDVPLEETPESRMILVVDDNDELRQFVVQALNLAGYGVVEAPDAQSTMDLVRATPRIDLVLCDVILPDKKGPELVNEIRSVLPDIEAIFMSGYVTEDIVNQDVENIVARGGTFLQKPFPTRRLLETVFSVLGV